MNATSLYVIVSKLVLQSTQEVKNSLADLVRLLPYLRQSLSCTVCSQLLLQPYTPSDSNCQHHVCKGCLGGKKKLKPACGWCKNYENYEENIQLRILLQCYKRLCNLIIHGHFYRMMSANSVEGNVTDLIDEGAAFSDEFKSNLGLTKSAYSILPCVYSAKQDEEKNKPSSYSVMYTDSVNKMVFKRKVVKAEKSVAKKSPHRKLMGFRRVKATQSEKKPRYGCRCGNATVTPGRLTCDGQRCPCYVLSKPCLNCKCRGCRNPRTLDGAKVIRDMGESQKESDDDKEDGTSQEESLLKDMSSIGDDLDHVLHTDFSLL